MVIVPDKHNLKVFVRNDLEIMSDYHYVIFFSNDLQFRKPQNDDVFLITFGRCLHHKDDVSFHCNSCEIAMEFSSSDSKRILH